MPAFTAAEQANHCDELVALLEKVPNKQYDQMVQTQASIEDKNSRSCALGWAASYGIGGLCFKYMKPQHPDCENSFTSVFAAAYTFGEDAYQHVFAVWKARAQNENSMTEKQLAISRLKQVAQALRKGTKVKLITK